jgi:hypothetical protein
MFCLLNRFLNERLVFGMAPTDIEAAFKQRLRWAMGALQVEHCWPISSARTWGEGSSPPGCELVHLPSQ